MSRRFDPETREGVNVCHSTELALAWFGKLDGLDVALLDLLSHGPHVGFPCSPLVVSHARRSLITS